MANVKRLIDANALVYYCKEIAKHEWNKRSSPVSWSDAYEGFIDDIDEMPTVDAVEVVHGRWELTAHEEYSNYRWNVTAECSECHHSKGEVYAGFFPGFPQELARMTVLDCAKSVKLDNYCPNCGAKMDGGNEYGYL